MKKNATSTARHLKRLPKGRGGRSSVTKSGNGALSAEEFKFPTTRKKQYGMHDNRLMNILMTKAAMNAQLIEADITGGKEVQTRAQTVGTYNGVRISRNSIRRYRVDHQVLKGTPTQCRQTYTHLRKVGITPRVHTLRFYYPEHTYSFRTFAKPVETPLYPFSGKQLLLTGIDGKSITRYKECEVEALVSPLEINSCKLVTKAATVTCDFATTGD